MARNTKIVIGLVAVLAVFMIAMFALASARNAAQTERAIGTVVATELEGRAGKRKTLVTFAYTADGVAAQGRDRVGGDKRADFPVGRQLPICFDPADRASLRIATGPCG